MVGDTPKEGSIELAIERDNRRDKMRVTLLPSAKARHAVTSYRRLAVGCLRTKQVANNDLQQLTVSLLECHQVTGRTHQIRVHLQSIGHPIVGDKIYGSKMSDLLAKSIGLDRQFLHAWRLELDDSIYQSKLPDELKEILTQLNIGIPDWKSPPIC